MKSWKSRLFGDTSQNFFSWLGAGLLLIVASLWLAILALRAGALESPEGLLLLAIYVVLVGKLALSLQNYHARLARKLDEDGKKDDEEVV